MNYDFIEIGTGNFDTLIEKATNEVGLSVEPLSIYLNKLPNKPNVIKANCAVSNTDGLIDIFWLHPDDINKHNLPEWLTGCNSIKEEHPTVKKILGDPMCSDLQYRKTICDCISWDTLIHRYDVKSIKFLKIDTEGHDLIILEAMIRSKYKVYPDKLQFECNTLTNLDKVILILEELKNLGYVMESQNEENIVMSLVR